MSEQPKLPDRCPICGKPTTTVQKHLRWVHSADLKWDDVAKKWNYVPFK